LLSPPIIALQSPIPEWDLQRIWYGLAAELQGSEELRVKSEKFELVPLAMAVRRMAFFTFDCSLIPLVAFDWKT